MPVAPTSRVRVMSQGSLLFTRHTEVMSHKSHARDICATWSQVIVPCSVSLHAPSKPHWPMESMISGLLSPPSTVATCPSRSFFLTLFSFVPGICRLLHGMLTSYHRLPSLAPCSSYFHSSSGGQTLELPLPAPWGPSTRQAWVVSRNLMRCGACGWAWNAASS